MSEQRVIKFRFWCQNIKEMSTDYTLDESGIQYYMGGNIRNDSPIALQYTGLKDKKGKEIYEGDIIQYEFQFDDLKYYIVKFGESETCSEDYYSSSFFGWFIDNGDRQNRLSSQDEVIGNIYENPELLTPDKDRTDKSAYDEYRTLNTNHKEDNE